MSLTNYTVTRDGGVAIITRTAPPLNLTTLSSTGDFRAILEATANDASIRVVIVTSAGDRFFGAGSDVTEFPDLVGEDLLTRKMTPENEALNLLATLPKPTIAALNGSALGGGLELALCCDFIVAAGDCSLGLPEIDLGLLPGDGGPVRLARRIGDSRAKRIMMLGQPVSAATALAWGLVDELADPGQALAQATDLAHRLAVKPAGALGAIKAQLARGWEPVAEDAALAGLEDFSKVFHSRDGREGVQAFLDKRPPEFD